MKPNSILQLKKEHICLTNNIQKKKVKPNLKIIPQKQQKIYLSMKDNIYLK